MSYRYICDHCQREIAADKVRIEFEENKKRISKDFHIDCFNYKFSCDIRKIKEDK